MTFGEDPLKESLATHSSILAWRIPWTEEPGRLWSRASKRVIHAWSDLAPIHWWLIPSEQCMIVVHCSVAKLCLTLQPHGLQQARLPCPSLSPGVCSNSCSLSWWCHPAISSSPSPSALNLFQHQGLFQWLDCLHQVAKVLELQYLSFQCIFRVDFL